MKKDSEIGGESASKYDPAKIEKKWQKKWQSTKLYRSKEDLKKAQNKKDDSKDKFYVLDMFPYPSGEGLHVGHPKGYIATDIISRMHRMQGKSVLHPMGFDAFGLPAENYAIKTKTNPADAVAKNVARYKEQLEILGCDYDWSREINTTDPEYYRWTQWIFLQMYKKGLAYESFEPINWCPSCKTGLANEDVEDGRCERCGTPVEKKPLRQWVLKITDYADRLLTDLDLIRGPVFTNTVGTDAFRNDMPVSERHVVHCLIKHWSEDRYLCMKWKKNDWKGFVIGGIENGESAEETAVREVKEETGYKNVVFKRIVGSMTAEFYQQIKKENRRAFITTVYLELKDGEQTDIPQHEKDIQDMEWVPSTQVRDFINRDDLKYEWDVFTGVVKQASLLDWPNSIKEAQKNWIGKSEGVNFKCKIKDLDIHVEMFNSVPQSYHAETFTIIAPEHKLIDVLIKGTEYEKSVREFVERIKLVKAGNKFNIDTDMEGIFTGRYIENFAGTGRDLPIWVASYALADYGTGIVNCSAHDVRDFAFAKKYNIPLRVVTIPSDPVLAEQVKKLEVAYARDPEGIMLEPVEFKGRTWGEARKDIIDYIVENGFGSRKVNYKLRDWVFSRQRYWGEPIPLIHCEKCGVVPVPEKDLPVKLPKVASYEPTGTGESPLAAIHKWVNVPCPKCKKPAKRETNTMPQWAGSSWYYLRYMDPKNKKALVDPKKEKYWAPVDLYVGGAEHATRHLIYARFWHKFLYDIGVVSTIEPFIKLQHVGLIMGEDGRKMSKRFGNVINPDEVVKNYGADSLRLYEMFMGPFDQQIAWSTLSITGVRRFIEKVWKLAEKIQITKKQDTNELLGDKSIDRILHKTIKKVTADIGTMSFNTAISTLMIAVNEINDNPTPPSRAQFEILLKLIAPFAPHVTEELWHKLGNKKSIHISDWPIHDEALTVEDEVNIIVQVNGKVRASFKASKALGEAELEAQAKAIPEVQKWLEGKSVKKVIVIKNKLVSIVLN